jgi:hypothetical protein
VNVCRYNRCHDNAVEGFWTLRDNIVTVFAALNFPVSLDELFHVTDTLKEISKLIHDTTCNNKEFKFPCSLESDAGP